jgi:hypothetical protein
MDDTQTGSSMSLFLKFYAHYVLTACGLQSVMVITYCERLDWLGIIDSQHNQSHKRWIRGMFATTLCIVNSAKAHIAPRTINFASIMGIIEDTDLKGQEYAWLTTCGMHPILYSVLHDLREKLLVYIAM